MKRHLFAGSLLATAALGTAGFANATTLTSQATVVPATTPVTFSVYLPLTNTAAMKALLTAQQTPGSPSYHQWLTPAQISAQFGPSPASFASAEAVLTAAGFTISGTHLRSIQVTGPASLVNKALLTTLKSVTSSGGGPRIISTTRITVPAGLPAGASIMSFAAIPEHQIAGVMVGSAPDNRNGPAGSYNYNDLKQAYDYPSYSELDGTGVHVAIVMEAAARNQDVAAMFGHEGFTTTTGKPAPTFTFVPIDGGGHYGGVNDGGTDEAELDVQMVLGGAPGSSVSQFSIPDLSDQHIIDAYETIVDSNAFDIVTSSFGECELFYSAGYNNGYDFTSELALYDEIFEMGNLEGITWFASSGDEGGLGCPPPAIVPHFIAAIPGGPFGFIKGVSTPATDPNVTSVGGGNLITTFTAPAGSNLNSAYISEQGFGDPEIPYDEFGIGVNLTGGYWGPDGGISQIFSKPSYQTLVNTGSSTFRTQPDIGMLVGGCPGGISQLPCGPDRSSVVVTIGAKDSVGTGARFGFIGTSVSSPELAGATAVALQGLRIQQGIPGGRLGNINPSLYALAAIQNAAGAANAPAAQQFYHMNIPGYDGAYTSSVAGGYNYIYGNGSPDVRKLFGLTTYDAAGVPRTTTNP